MMLYARQDTHYLLYIYDELRKEIIKKSLDEDLNSRDCLLHVLESSANVCLKTYTKPILKDDSYYSLVARNQQIMSKNKCKLLKKMLKFRDGIARKEDESVRSILQNNIMFQLIDKKPNDEKELIMKFGRNLSFFMKKIYKRINRNFKLQF